MGCAGSGSCGCPHCRARRRTGNSSRPTSRTRNSPSGASSRASGNATCDRPRRCSSLCHSIPKCMILSIGTRVAVRLLASGARWVSAVHRIVCDNSLPHRGSQSLYLAFAPSGLFPYRYTIYGFPRRAAFHLKTIKKTRCGLRRYTRSPCEPAV